MPKAFKILPGRSVNQLEGQEKKLTSFTKKSFSGISASPPLIYIKYFVEAVVFSAHLLFCLKLEL